MASTPTDFQDLQQKKRALLELLSETQNQIIKQSDDSFDIHHPERSPNWKQYRHQSFPKVLYHRAHNDPKIEAERNGIMRRNAANPTLPPMPLPASTPATVIVNTEEELKLAESQGYVTAQEAHKRIQELILENAGVQGTLDPLTNPEIASKFTSSGIAEGDSNAKRKR